MTKIVFEDAYMEDGKLYFDKRAAADIEVFNSLRDLTDASYGEKEAEDWLDFTPGFGACKNCNDIEEFIVEYCKKENIKEAYFRVEWFRHCIYEINPKTLELGEFLESSGIDGDYYSCIDGEIDYCEPLDDEDDD
jgi:hypothetical protein